MWSGCSLRRRGSETLPQSGEAHIRRIWVQSFSLWWSFRTKKRSGFQAGSWNRFPAWIDCSQASWDSLCTSKSMSRYLPRWWGTSTNFWRRRRLGWWQRSKKWNRWRVWALISISWLFPLRHTLSVRFFPFCFSWSRTTNTWWSGYNKAYKDGDKAYQAPNKGINRKYINFPSNYKYMSKFLWTNEYFLTQVWSKACFSEARFFSVKAYF